MAVKHLRTSEISFPLDLVSAESIVFRLVFSTPLIELISSEVNIVTGSMILRG